MKWSAGLAYSYLELPRDVLKSAGNPHRGTPNAPDSFCSVNKSRSRQTVLIMLSTHPDYIMDSG
jgi:hypothetical protein